MKKFVGVACGTTAMLVLAVGHASAGQTGLASMHEQHVVNGRLCFSDHPHNGSGSTFPSKRQALASALQDWTSHTASEYGSSWASWQAATAKKINCHPYWGKWACEVEAKPCLVGNDRGRRQARR